MGSIFYVLICHLKKGVGLMRVSMHDWTTEDALILLSGWARSGLTFEQIASNMGISRNTLQNWRKKSTSIAEAIHVNKEIADYHVENTMYKSALGFSYQEQVVTNKGEVVWVTKYERPNVTAQIFWLKNRKPEVWTDRREIKHEAKIENVEYIAEWGKSE
jgi:transcriptional regulator with XRE-family HTH domain